MATDLKGELTCPICMELFKRPLRLPCGHSYCHHCLHTFIGQHSHRDIVTGQHRPVNCPECRYQLDVTCEGADAFAVDFKLSKLVDVYLRMEDLENRNEVKKSTGEGGGEGEKDEETEPPGACGYTPAPPAVGRDTYDIIDGNDCDKTTESDKDIKCGTGNREKTRKDGRKDEENTRPKTMYDDSDSDSEKEQSDDSGNKTVPRRRKRRNKVIRFFASLLSLSSSDGEYSLNETTSSSDDIDTSRPVRDPIPKEKKEVPRRRNRWGFFTSSSDSESENEGRAGRRRPARKPSGVVANMERRLKPSSDDDDKK